MKFPSWIKCKVERVDGTLTAILTVRKWHPMFWFEVLKGAFK